jgi:ribose transport system substrate-binding protein
MGSVSYRRTLLRLGIAVPAVVAAIAGAGCGSSTTNDGPSASTGSSSPAAAKPAASSMVNSTGLVAKLDKTVQAGYEDSAAPSGPSPYVAFKPKGKPPWTIGYSSAYAGNTWRGVVVKQFEAVAAQYEKAGLVSKFIIKQANLNTGTQIQQIKQLADEGADAIIACCPVPTGLNGAIKSLHAKGIPFVVFDGDTTSPYSQHTGVNYSLAGLTVSRWLGGRIGGKGNVLVVSGIPGFPASDRFDEGVAKGLGESSGIKVVGKVAGQWTDSVAKTEVLKFLATHPGKLDGVVVQSGSASGVVQALQQSGRPVPPVTIGGEAGAACYWKQHPNWIDRGFHIWPPTDEAQLAFETTMRILEGQGPKIQSFVRGPEPFAYDTVQKLPADCSVSSPDWLAPAAGTWFGAKVLDGFFERPADPLTFGS